jgi:hypothetical protein
MVKARITALGLALAMLGAAPALAQSGFESAYTDLNLDDCLVISSDDFGSVWACPGYKGYPLRVAEGDLRFFLSYGFGAEDEPAAEQTAPPFNTLGPKIEWRLSNASGRFMPIATIVRYLTEKEGGEGQGQVLAVTQLVPGATCHIAYIDATANSNANEMARQAADEKAGSHDCAEEPEIIGEFAAW